MGTIEFETVLNESRKKKALFGYTILSDACNANFFVSKLTKPVCVQSAKVSYLLIFVNFERKKGHGRSGVSIRGNVDLLLDIF